VSVPWKVKDEAFWTIRATGLSDWSVVKKSMMNFWIAG
jgi:hypothetical protein